MKNNLINKILEELKDINSKKAEKVRSVFFNVTGGADFETDEEGFIFYELDYKDEAGLRLLLLTAFATLPYFLKIKTNQYIHETIKRQNSNSIRGRITNSNLGQLLSYTLVDNLTNSNWLEVLEKTYNDNII